MSEDEFDGSWSSIVTPVDVVHLKTDSATGRPDDGLESDNSNFDVIPFSESEYEKISMDTDGKQDDDMDCSVTGAMVVELGAGMKDITGTDSALGRSVSDHSLSLGDYALARANGTSLLSQGSQTTGADLPSTQCGYTWAGKGDIPDVGYSSDGQSNDEPEYNNHSVATTSSGVGLSLENLHSLSRDSRSPARKDTGVGIRNGADHKSRPGSGNSAAPGIIREEPNRNATWRHSMTSAYDTNGSDGHSPDEQATLVKKVPGIQIQRRDPATAIAVPNQSFYRMTAVDLTDSESYNAAERDRYIRPGHYIEESRSGAATDAESELSKSLELPYDDTPIRFETQPRITDPGVGSSQSHGHCLNRDSVRQKLDTLFEKSSTSLSGFDPSHQVTASENSASEQAPDVESYESHAIFEMDLKNDSKSTQSEKGSMKTGHGTDEVALSALGMAQARATLRSRDCVSKLLRQAELMVRDEDLSLLNRTPCYPENEENPSVSRRTDNVPISVNLENKASNKKSRRRRRRKRRTATAIPSSCDASSEGSTGSGSDPESSATSSDEDTAGLSNHLMSRSLDSAFTSPLGIAPGLNKSKSPTKRRLPMDRASSESQLYEPSSDHKLSETQHSKSESAITLAKTEALSASTNKLRRMTSDMASIPMSRKNSPKKVRRRRARQAGSDTGSSQCGSHGNRTSSSPTRTRHSTPRVDMASGQGSPKRRSTSQIVPCQGLCKMHPPPPPHPFCFEKFRPWK